MSPTWTHTRLAFPEPPAQHPVSPGPCGWGMRASAGPARMIKVLSCSRLQTSFSSITFSLFSSFYFPSANKKKKEKNYVCAQPHGHWSLGLEVQAGAEIRFPGHSLFSPCVSHPQRNASSFLLFTSSNGFLQHSPCL